MFKTRIKIKMYTNCLIKNHIKRMGILYKKCAHKRSINCKNKKTDQSSHSLTNRPPSTCTVRLPKMMQNLPAMKSNNSPNLIKTEF